MANLGLIYYQGQGVPQDFKKAIDWSEKAAALGDKRGAKNRDFVKKTLTPLQIEDGEDLAKTWFINHPFLLDKARMMHFLQ